jgi:hypothetical protein
MTGGDGKRPRSGALARDDSAATCIFGIVLIRTVEKLGRIDTTDLLILSILS